LGKPKSSGEPARTAAGKAIGKTAAARAPAMRSKRVQYVEFSASMRRSDRRHALPIRHPRDVVSAIALA